MKFFRKKKKKKKDRSLDRKIRNSFYENILTMPIEERMM